MEGENYKEVYFIEYCATCTNKDTPEDEEPCFSCLQVPARENSHKPEKYEEDK